MPGQVPPDRPPTEQVPVDQLRKGHRIDGATLLVEVANFKQTRNSKHFIQMQLRDRTGSVKAVRWEATQDLFANMSSSDYVRITGRVEEFQQHLQIVVDEIQPVPAESVNSSNFLPSSERDVEEMERELLAAVAQVGDEHIRALLVALLEDPEVLDGLRRCPAGKAMHHAYTGGLLEHVVSLVDGAQKIAKLYPELDLDVLVAAAVLHDLGKIRELSYSHAFRYTDEGQLVGHIGIGLVLTSEKAKAIPGFPPETLQHLLHLIASHHGVAEHGALKLPMTPEAVAFHFLDNLDAKMSTLRALKKEVEATEAATDQDTKWSEYKPALGRRFYFPS